MPKRIVISKVGGPEVLKYEDYNIATTLEDNSVRIKQSAIGLNYIDTYHRSGIYPLPSDPPVCPGIEAAGTIIKLGKKVNNLKVGDKVCYASTPLGAYCEIRDFPS
jgi:NADPH:quinone reductase and related Zn-dependent oxidoreductases